MNPVDTLVPEEQKFDYNKDARIFVCYVYSNWLSKNGLRAKR